MDCFVRGELYQSFRYLRYRVSEVDILDRYESNWIHRITDLITDLKSRLVFVKFRPLILKDILILLPGLNCLKDQNFYQVSSKILMNKYQIMNASLIGISAKTDCKIYNTVPHLTYSWNLLKLFCARYLFFFLFWCWTRKTN